MSDIVHSKYVEFKIDLLIKKISFSSQNIFKFSRKNGTEIKVAEISIFFFHILDWNHFTNRIKNWIDIKNKIETEGL